MTRNHLPQALFILALPGLATACDCSGHSPTRLRDDSTSAQGDTPAPGQTDTAPPSPGTPYSAPPPSVPPQPQQPRPRGTATCPPALPAPECPHCEPGAACNAQRLCEPGTRPPAMDERILAHDPIRQRIVLHGRVAHAGTDGLWETWEYDGTTWYRLFSAWAARAPAPFPIFTTHRAFAYFNPKAAQVNILELNLWSSSPSSHWRWNGHDWLPIPVSGQPNGTTLVAAYDTHRQRLVVLGTRASPTEVPAVWEFDGTTWTTIHQSLTPEDHTVVGLVFDPTRRLTYACVGSEMFATPDTCDSFPAWDGTRWTPKPGLPQATQILAPPFYDPARRAIALVTLSASHRRDQADLWTFHGDGWLLASSAIPRATAVFAATHSTDTGTARFAFGPSPTDNAYGTWDASGWHELAPDERFPIRAAYAAATDPRRNRIVAYGGLTSFFDYASGTWEWDGHTWNERTPVHPPPTRFFAGMAYHPQLKRVVLYGGSGFTGFTELFDTWSWDGCDWYEETPATVPISGLLPSLVPDPLGRGVAAVSLNHYSNSNPWLFDGHRWLEIPSSPTPLYAYPAAYDSHRRRAVAINRPARYEHASTWEWDGTTWAERGPAPSALNPQTSATLFEELGAMAYDPTRQRTVLLVPIKTTEAATGRPFYTADTWEWNGSTWARATPVQSPYAFGFGVMAFDPVRERIVVFAGMADNWRLFHDAWEYDGATWSRIGPTGPYPPPPSLTSPRP